MEEKEELNTQLLWTISGLGFDKNITPWSPVGMSGVAVQTDIFTFPPHTRYPLCLKLNLPIIKSSTDRGVMLLDFVFWDLGKQPPWHLQPRRNSHFQHFKIFFIIQDTHVLMHFVKSACLYSINPFSILFSANIQHNYPILFCICPTELPAGLAFRFSFQK